MPFFTKGSLKSASPGPFRGSIWGSMKVQEGSLSLGKVQKQAGAELSQAQISFQFDAHLHWGLIGNSSSYCGKLVKAIICCSSWVDQITLNKSIDTKQVWQRNCFRLIQAWKSMWCTQVQKKFSRSNRFGNVLWHQTHLTWSNWSYRISSYLD